MNSEAIPHGAIKTFQWKEVPIGWRFELLGGVASVRRGSSPRPAGDPRYFGGTIPWFKIGDATRSRSRFLSATEEFVNEEGAKCSVRIPPGSLIVANSGVSLGFAVIPEIEGCIHDGWLLLDNLKGVDRDFLYYCINHFTPHIRHMADGTTQPNLNTDIARRLLIPLPPLAEQRAIASVLGALDDKIELNRRMNETVEGLARALFRNWFVDAAAGAPPKGWTIRALYDCADYINGAAFRNEHFSPNRLGLPVIKISELKNGVTGQTKFSEIELEPKYRIASSDILFSWSGSPDTSIDTFLWTGGDGWLNQHIFKIQFKRPVEKFFVYYSLRHFKAEFIEIARNKQTTGLGHITAQDLKRLKTAFPPDNVLMAFNRAAEPLFQKSYNNNCESCTLAALRDALLPKLLSGELRVLGGA